MIELGNNLSFPRIIKDGLNDLLKFQVSGKFQNRDFLFWKTKYEKIMKGLERKKWKVIFFGENSCLAPGDVFKCY